MFLLTWRTMSVQKREVLLCKKKKIRGNIGCSRNEPFVAVLGKWILLN